MKAKKPKSILVYRSIYVHHIALKQSFASKQSRKLIWAGLEDNKQQNMIVKDAIGVWYDLARLAPTLNASLVLLKEKGGHNKEEHKTDGGHS